MPNDRGSRGGFEGDLRCAHGDQVKRGRKYEDGMLTKSSEEDAGGSDGLEGLGAGETSRWSRSQDEGHASTSEDLLEVKVSSCESRLKKYASRFPDLTTKPRVDGVHVASL